MNDKCLLDYKYYFSERFNLFSGNSLEVLPFIADNSIDSVVTDPPYELGFMGKSWDSTGIANDPKLWKEVLRVLKPGGHILAFGGSRTYHRMAVAIEDAGFEIRDQIMWVYGSGFPKSLNIDKAIDKAAGVEREVVGSRVAHDIRNNNLMEATQGLNRGTMIYEYTKATTKEAKQWQGWGTALKPAHEPIVLARKPFPKGFTVANNVLTFGTGGLNIDATRVATDDAFGGGAKGTSGFAAGYDADGWVAGSDQGRFPANFIHDGSDEVVALFPEKTGGGHWAKTKVSGFGEFGGGKSEYLGQGEKDGFGSAARFFYCAKASKRDRNEGLEGFEAKISSKFAQDKWTIENMAFAKTQPSANHHPTVKPTDLMQYLVRLITPPNGIVLDPFLGSGSTGKAAMYEGFNFVGIELTQEYLPIAKARIEFALSDLDEKLF